MITLDAYKLAKQKIEEFDKEQKELHQKHSEERDKLQNKYWKLERELRDKKFKEEKQFQIKHNAENEQIKRKRQDYDIILAEFSRIMHFIEIHKSEKTTDFLVYEYEGSYPDHKKLSYKPIDMIKDDKYAKIQVFITENNKPKNKFTLMIAGSTIFNERIFDNIPYGYGYDCHTELTNILKTLSDKPTEEELRAYYKRNKERFLKEFLEEHQKIEQEYEEIIQNTNNKQWEFIYWEKQKEYYEHHYNRGTETEEYQQILKQLKKLKRRGI